MYSNSTADTSTVVISVVTEGVSSKESTGSNSLLVTTQSFSSCHHELACLSGPTFNAICLMDVDVEKSRNNKQGNQANREYKSCF